MACVDSRLKGLGRLNKFAIRTSQFEISVEFLVVKFAIRISQFEIRIAPRFVAMTGRLFLVSAASVVAGSHEHQLLFFVNFIEEPPGPNAVSPGGGIPVLEPLDVGAEMGFLAEPRIDRFPKLLVETAESGPSELRQILTEARRFEDPVPNQPESPSSVSPPGSLS